MHIYILLAEMEQIVKTFVLNLKKMKFFKHNFIMPKFYCIYLPNNLATNPIGKCEANKVRNQGAAYSIGDTSNLSNNS